MDMDMSAFLEAVAEASTKAPRADAPADYLYQRAHITADALRAVADGEHPAETLETMEERLEVAARPVASDALMVWSPAPALI